ncbi:MAG: hypothetical protein ABI610_00770 [Acidobacteriota bacterium]
MKRAVAVMLLATGVAAAESPSPIERAACLRLLEDSTAETAKAVLRFEATVRHRDGDTSAARDVLVAASAARDGLEAAAVSAVCEPSRREELIYLNHLTLGFAGWIAARSRRPPAEYDLASIVRRARVHQARGRARLG